MKKSNLEKIIKNKMKEVGELCLTLDPVKDERLETFNDGIVSGLAWLLNEIK